MVAMPTLIAVIRSAWVFPADQELSLLDIKELDQTCSYSWVVQTRYSANPTTGSGRITVSFVGSRRSRSYSYRHALSPTENHLAAAVVWLQQLAGSNGALSYALVAKASTPTGFVFTFR